MGNGESSYRRFLDGDEKAFDEVINTYRAGLIFFIDQYLQDYHASEDIAIDAFMYLLVHKHRYNFKTSLKTYLYMIGRSKALNYLKRRKHFQMVDLDIVDGEVCDSAELEKTLIEDENNRRLHQELKKLPDDIREAIHLVYFESLSYEEAGKVMKKNRKQIDNLIFRGKKELKSIFEGEGGFLL